MRALPLDELKAMFHEAGVPATGTAFYRLAVGLEPLLHASATPGEAADEVRRLLAADIGHDGTGMTPHRIDGDIHFSFPVVVLAGRKA